MQETHIRIVCIKIIFLAYTLLFPIRSYFCTANAMCFMP